MVVDEGEGGASRFGGGSRGGGVAIVRLFRCYVT